MALDWNDRDQKEICRLKPCRMAERSKAPDSRNSSVENSGTRVCAWVPIPLLSENVLNTMKHSLQLTNSVILERQFKMTVQSKRKQKTRNVIGRLIAEQFKSAQKRGYPAETCKTRLYAWVQMQIFPNRWHKPFSRLHLWIENVTPLKWHRSKRKYVDVNQAGWPSGLRRQTQEIPQSRILVHHRVRGIQSHSCQKTFWTRWGRAFSWQILSYWNVNSRWQSKAKENKRLATSLGGW